MAMKNVLLIQKFKREVVLKQFNSCFDDVNHCKCCRKSRARIEYQIKTIKLESIYDFECKIDRQNLPYFGTISTK